MDSPQKDRSILVVGAGPVGMSVGVELLRRGLKARIIDAAEGPAGESRALAIHARTLEIFEPAGITPLLLAAGQPVRRAVFSDEGGDFLIVDFSHFEDRFNFILVLPQSETERILKKYLEGKGQVIEWQTRLSRLEQQGGKVQCTIVNADGSESTETFETVIGTDGAHSTVRNELGIEFAGKSFDHNWYLADVRFCGDRPVDEARIKLLQGEAIAHFPLKPNIGRFIHTRDNPMAHVEKEFDVEEVLWQSSFRISHRIVERYQKGNVFLAGDAAHIHSPVGGRGMNLGIEDAATLAWLLERNESDRYTSLRLPIGKKVLAFTHAQTRQITTTNPLVRFLTRRIAPIMLRSKAVHRLAFHRLSGRDTPRPPWLT